MKFSPSLFALLFLSTLFVQACKDDDGEGDPGNSCESSFDQEAMFENIADNIIIPQYLALQEKINTLEDQGNAFVASPTADNLLALQETWLTANLVWQMAAQYEFGPAETVFLRNSLNNFPTNTAAIEANIQAESYDFDQPDAYDKGFPALDYLLFGLENGETAAIVSKYDTGTDAEKYRAYLSRVIADMKTRVDQVNTAWANGYRNDFVKNLGNAAGASLSLLINGLNLNYELIKREKIGIPSGVMTLGFANPDKVEALYSGQSLALAVAGLEASQQLYLGLASNDIDGLGFDDYLRTVVAKKGEDLLDDLIQAQFTKTIDVIKALQGPLSETVETDQASVEAAYTEVVRQIVNIKTDLPSVLCVSITYIDNPSDSD